MNIEFSKLGDIVYWVGCGIAALCMFAVMFDLFTLSTGELRERAGGLAEVAPAVMFAVIAWSVGRGLRYILSGR